jgi:hypothetical protein
LIYQDYSHYCFSSNKAKPQTGFTNNQNNRIIQTRFNQLATASLDTVSFTSFDKPTRREKNQIEEINNLVQKHLLQPIKTSVKDVSAAVRLKAYEAILLLDPLKYNKTEKAKLIKAEELATQTMKKYDNGKNIDQFIKDLKQNGFKFYFADDYLPEDLWTDEDFLESWNMDEAEIDDQLETNAPLRVRDVLKNKDCAEIHYERDDCQAMFLFSQNKPSPETFWHEWFHYCQKEVGLFKPNVNPLESRGSAFAKRELETYQFIIKHRNQFKTKLRNLMLDIAIWNSYKDLYHYEKDLAQKEKSKTIVPSGKPDYQMITTHTLNQSMKPLIISNIHSKPVSRERELVKEFENKYTLKLGRAA